MASGSFRTEWGNYTNKYALIVDWVSNSNTAANSSTVTLNIKLYCPYAAEITARYDNTATINGVTFYYDSPAVKSSGGTTTLLATITSGAIPHNTDGTKSIAVSVDFRFNAYLSGVHYGRQTASANIALDNIPRAAVLTEAPNFNDEQNPTIKYTNAAGNAVSALKACISFDGAIDDIPFRNVSKTGNAYTFNLTTAERTKIHNFIKAGSAAKVTYSLATQIGGVWYYSKKTAIVSLINAEPIVNPEIYDTDAHIVGLTGNKNITMKNYSDIYYDAHIETRKGATIKSIRVTDGLTVKTTATGTFVNVDSHNLTFTITDSRGLVTTKNVSQPTFTYTKLTSHISGTLETDGKMTITINGNYFNSSFGAQRNTIGVEYRIKENSGSWSAWEHIPATVGEYGVNHTYEATVIKEGYDYRNSYKVQARATDEVMSVTTADYQLMSYPVFDWSATDFNFNVPVTIQGNPIADFIVDQGESGGWFYRKWNSGIAECWKIYYGTTNASATNYNGYYYSTTITEPYPFTFTNLPCLQANGGSTANMNFVRVFGLYEDAASFVVCGHAANATNTSITVNLYAIGRWK